MRFLYVKDFIQFFINNFQIINIRKSYMLRLI